MRVVNAFRSSQYNNVKKPESNRNSFHEFMQGPEFHLNDSVHSVDDTDDDSASSSSKNHVAPAPDPVLTPTAVLRPQAPPRPRRNSRPNDRQLSLPASIHCNSNNSNNNNNNSSSSSNATSETAVLRQIANSASPRPPSLETWL
ncbi:hypothetical protein NHX12_013443 [Muraenolepis orangiensis]|uniref:Plasma membrane calcium transporting P-type ATPase C-terminal domain-containing protein n=1 Tax=Muraenolepis orangiensis TaxID=630683 RepID=A0A9Q0I6W6_9TELE|nr:hypothetical protein NHX12_013443 [Muraenolepis orangiensis]